MPGIVLPRLRALPKRDRELVARQKGAVRAAERVEEAAVRLVQARLGQLRLDLLSHLVRAESFSGTVNVQQAVALIQAEVGRAAAALLQVSIAATRETVRAAVGGQVLLREPVRAARAQERRPRVTTEEGPDGGVPRIRFVGETGTSLLQFGGDAATREVLQALTELTAEEVTTLTTRLRDGMVGAVRRAAVSGLTLVEATQAVDRALPAARRGARVTERTGSSAARIVRTQLNRAYGLAQRAGAEQLQDELGVQLEKEWIAVLDARTRGSHVRAHGQRVPVDEPFVVGGVRLMHPADPAGPPQETINCRCRMVTMLPDNPEDLFR